VFRGDAVAADAAGFCVEARRVEGAGALGAGGTLARSASLSEGSVGAAAVGCSDSVGDGTLGDGAARGIEEADGLDGGMTSGLPIRGASEGGSVWFGSGGSGAVRVASCGVAWRAATTSAVAQCQA